jgi:hypothetical protein
LLFRIFRVIVVDHANVRGGCSPTVLHFHLARTHAPVNVATFNQTVYVDGRKIYEDGKLTILEEAEIEKLAKTFGTPATLLEQNRIDLS